MGRAYRNDCVITNTRREWPRFALKQPEVGGLAGLFAKVDPQSLNLLPDFGDWSVALAAFIIPITIQWWSDDAVPPGRNSNESWRSDKIGLDTATDRGVRPARVVRWRAAKPQERLRPAIARGGSCSPTPRGMVMELEPIVYRIREEFREMPGCS